MAEQRIATAPRRGLPWQRGVPGETVADSGETVAAEASQIGSDLAGYVVDEVRGAVEAALDEQKARLAGALHGFAALLHRAAADREAGGPLVGLVDRAASRIGDFAGDLRTRPVGDLVAETEALARRRPELFVAGAAALGLVLGRILAASAARARAGASPTLSGAAGRLR